MHEGSHNNSSMNEQNCNEVGLLYTNLENTELKMNLKPVLKYYRSGLTTSILL